MSVISATSFVPALVVGRLGLPDWLDLIRVTMTAAITPFSAAPMQNIMGSFFPSWMLCAIAGVVVMVAVRQALVVLHIHENLPVPLLTYFAVALIIACAIWLVFFVE